MQKIIFFYRRAQADTALIHFDHVKSPTPANGNEHTAKEGVNPTGVMMGAPTAATFMNHSSNLIRLIVQFITQSGKFFIKILIFNTEWSLQPDFIYVYCSVEKAVYNSRNTTLFCC